MAAYVPGDDTESTFITEKNTQVGYLNTYGFNGSFYRMIATTTTTVVEFRGLKRAQALAMGDSADYNYKALHGVSFTSGLMSMSMPDCEGVECKAVPRRINEADMFRVIVTYSSTVVTHSGDWSKSTF